jgi:transposase
MMHVGFVKPYVKTNKNDAIDAEAICEAVRRPTMRFVPIKSIKQQGAVTIHRAREALIREQKSLMLVLRSLLAEFGIVARRGTPGARATLEFAQTSTVRQLPKTARDALQLIVEEVRALKLRIKAFEAVIGEGHKKDSQSQRIATIPNIGPVTASAIRAIIGDGRQFRSGREFSAWIGLVPRQYSSGGKTRLGHIPRGGNAYLRKLLYFAATAALGKPNRTGARIFVWARALRRRKPLRVTAIALASKFARVIWAILRDRCDFAPRPARAVRF